MKRAVRLHSIAFFLILGVALCADGLVESPAGIAAMFGSIILAGLLILLSEHTPKKKTARQGGTLSGRSDQHSSRYMKPPLL